MHKEHYSSDLGMYVNHPQWLNHLSNAVLRNSDYIIKESLSRNEPVWGKLLFTAEDLYYEYHLDQGKQTLIVYRSGFSIPLLTKQMILDWDDFYTPHVNHRIQGADAILKWLNEISVGFLMEEVNRLKQSDTMIIAKSVAQLDKTA